MAYVAKELQNAIIARSSGDFPHTEFPPRMCEPCRLFHQTQPLEKERECEG
jgi:hypothetical protein